MSTSNESYLNVVFDIINQNYEVSLPIYLSNSVFWQLVLLLKIYTMFIH